MTQMDCVPAGEFSYADAELPCSSGYILPVVRAEIARRRLCDRYGSRLLCKCSLRSTSEMCLRHRTKSAKSGSMVRLLATNTPASRRCSHRSTSHNRA